MTRGWAPRHRSNPCSRHCRRFLRVINKHGAKARRRACMRLTLAWSASAQQQWLEWKAESKTLNRAGAFNCKARSNRGLCRTSITCRHSEGIAKEVARSWITAQQQARQMSDEEGNREKRCKVNEAMRNDAKRSSSLELKFWLCNSKIGAATNNRAYHKPRSVRSALVRLVECAKTVQVGNHLSRKRSLWDRRIRQVSLIINRKPKALWVSVRVTHSDKRRAALWCDLRPNQTGSQLTARRSQVTRQRGRTLCKLAPAPSGGVLFSAVSPSLPHSLADKASLSRRAR